MLAVHTYVGEHIRKRMCTKSVFILTEIHIQVNEAMDENVLPPLPASLPPLGPTGCPASLPALPEAAPCDCSSPSAHVEGS